MPGEDGKLTQEDKNKVIEYLKTRWKAPQACPICGESQWFVADHLVTPTIMGPGASFLLGGVAYPLVMLVSTPCGYTRFLNAMQIPGLVPPTPSESSPVEEKKEGA